MSSPLVATASRRAARAAVESDVVGNHLDGAAVLAHGDFLNAGTALFSTMALMLIGLLVGCVAVLARQRIAAHRRRLTGWVSRQIKKHRLEEEAAAQRANPNQLIGPYSGLLDDIEQRAGLAAFAQSQKEQAKFAKQRHSFLKAVLDSIGASVCIVDRSGSILEHNARWMRLRCFVDREAPPTRGESLVLALNQCGDVRGDTLQELITPLKAFRCGERVGHSATHRARLGSRTQWLHAQLAPVEETEDLEAAVLCLFNVTERVEAERAAVEAQTHTQMLADALQTSRETLTRTMDAAELATWQWDTETGHVDYGAYWHELVGKPREAVEHTLDELLSRVHEQDAARAKATFTKAAGDESQKGVDLEFRVQLESGDYRWIHVRGRVIQESVPGVPRVMAGVVSDVNDRREAQARSEALARLLDAASAELVVLDASTLQIVEVTGNIRQMAEKSHGELVGRGLHELLTAESYEAFLRSLQAEEAEAGCGASLEWRWELGEGGSRTVAGRVQRTTYFGSPAVAMHGVDVTEKQQLEARLAQAKKLESIGQLAAGVAHEINTPMQYVNSNVEFLKEAVPEVMEIVDRLKETAADANLPGDVAGRIAQLDGMLAEAGYDELESSVNAALDDCGMGIERVVEIVRAMKEFSHPGTNDHSDADINELLRSAVIVSKNQWKFVAEVRQELDETLPAVSCLGAELSQVFLNLIVNASDAVSEASLDDSPDSGTIWVRSRLGDDEVIVEVEDSGPGVPEAIRDRLFDPFFTTKDVGQGSGQGLAISHDVVVNKHGGSLSLISEPGRGACFRVVLPLTPREPAATTPPLENAASGI